MQPACYPWKIPWHLVLIFLLLSAGILVLGYVYYESQVAHYQREMKADLNAIADLKAKEIMAWRQERLKDGRSIMEDPMFAAKVKGYFDGTSPPWEKHEILFRLKCLKQDLYESVKLLDSRGQVRLAIPVSQDEVSPNLREVISEAVSGEKVVFADLHLSPEKELALCIVVPLHFHEDGKKTNVGTLILRVNPRQGFYPLTLSWPTLNSTGEFTLYRREGNEVVCLNELRHRKNTALTLRIPLTQKNNPGVQAALGREKIAPGIDYRGVPVLAASRMIPNSPWFLTAKSDIAEVYQPARQHLYTVVSILFALIATSGVGLTFLWRRREVDYYRQQYEGERERLALAKRYEYLTRYANEAILIMDKDCKIIEANDQAVRSYGYEREELLRLCLCDLYPSDRRLEVLETVEQNRANFETVHRRKDGTIFPVAVSSSILEIEGDKFYQTIIRDITQSKQREQALQYSEQQLRYLSSQLLKIQEEERRRIAKELHDELGQALMVLKFQIESIEAGLAQGKKHLMPDFPAVLHYLDSVIETVRRLSWDLSPAMLEELGLSAALKKLLEEFGEYFEISWSPENVAELDRLFSPLKAVNIYRIFQESLTNIGRHAQASKISISIEKQNGTLAFIVEDNGQGFDVDQMRGRGGRERGIGLAAMEERARLAGGSLKIWSKPGAGTKITFTLPLNNREE
jgi:PAS domain S-box-containing protein